MLHEQRQIRYFSTFTHIHVAEDHEHALSLGSTRTFPSISQQLNTLHYFEQCAALIPNMGTGISCRSTQEYYHVLHLHQILIMDHNKTAYLRRANYESTLLCPSLYNNFSKGGALTSTAVPSSFIHSCFRLCRSNTVRIMNNIIPRLARSRLYL